MIRRNCAAWLCAVVLAGFSGKAAAALVTLSGTAFDVTYDTNQLGLFGTPQLVGSTVFFTPSAFDVQSPNFNGTGVFSYDTFTRSSSVWLRISGHTGAQVSAVDYRANGDYLLQGQMSTVSVAGSVRASDPASSLVASQALVLGAPLDVRGSLTNWNGEALLNLPPAQWNLGVIDIVLDSTLIATTNVLDPAPDPLKALVEQRYGGARLNLLFGQPTGVPSPGSLALVALGMSLLVVTRRRMSGSLRPQR